jgi:hypothetical protein
MDYETFSYDNIRHILYISYHGIICPRCNARVLTSKLIRVTCNYILLWMEKVLYSFIYYF